MNKKSKKKEKKDVFFYLFAAKIKVYFLFPRK